MRRRRSAGRRVDEITSMTTRAWRPVGFLLLMLGFGLRLDTAWETFAWLVLAAGAACLAVGASG